MRLARAFVCLILLGGSLAAQTSVIQAAQPSSNALEQHWELLAETGSYTGSKTLDIRRGDLPEGTSKFDPAPVATLEVVGKHTGGSGASKWEVALMATSTEVLATVDFLVTDGTLKIKTAPISWPSSNKPLRSLRLSKIHDGLNLAGTFAIQKAYIKFRQTGTIKRTVGRVPISTKQTSIGNTEWQDLAEVAYYQHLPADFNPAPTIKFRTTGVETTSNPLIQTLHVRLVDSSGAFLAGSEQNHAALGSVTSPALTLTPNALYKVQVKVTMFPQNGELFSADLVLEQASSDGDGLDRTVSWFPSVTAATTLATDGTDLGYLFNSPDLSALEVSRTFAYSARRLSGTGSLAVDLRDTNGSGLSFASGAFSAPDFAFEGVDVGSVPPAGHDVDSRSIAAAGSSGRVSASILRVAVDLQPLQLVHVPQSQAAWEGLDLGIDVSVTSACAASCGSIEVEVHYIDPAAIERVDSYSLAHDDSQDAIFWFPPDHVVAPTLTYWIEAEQNTSFGVMVARAPTAATLPIDLPVEVLPLCAAEIALPEVTPPDGTEQASCQQVLVPIATRPRVPLADFPDDIEYANSGSSSPGTAGYTYQGPSTHIASAKSAFLANAPRNYYGIGGNLRVSNPSFGSQSCGAPTDHFYARYAVSGWYYGVNAALKSASIELGWIKQPGTNQVSEVWMPLLVWDEDEFGDAVQEEMAVANVTLSAGASLIVRIERSIRTPRKWYTWLIYNGKRTMVGLRSNWMFDAAHHVQARFEQNKECSNADINPAPGTQQQPAIGTSSSISVNTVRILETPNSQKTAWTTISKAWNSANYPAGASTSSPTRTNSQSNCIGNTTVCYQLAWTASWHGFTLRKP